MPVEYQGRKMSKQDAVSAVLTENNIDLDPPVSVYVDRIENSTSAHEPLSTENLLRYLVAGIDVIDEDTKRAKRELAAVIDGNSPESVGNADLEAKEVTEQELEDIMRGFEAFTEQKVRRDKLLTMGDFENYAKNTGFSVQKVLYSADWLDSCIDDEVINRIEEAEESLTLV